MKSASVSLEAPGRSISSAEREHFQYGFRPAAVAHRVVGICWILRRLQNRVRAHVSPSPGFRSLAAEFCPGCGAFADATTRLVVRAAGRVSCAFGGAIPESRSTADDFMLVHQQFVRSTDRRRFDTLPRRRTDWL